MASGRSLQLTKQIGENLAVVELGRRGYIATTFTGNVPDFDILGTSPQGKAFHVQVKTIQGGSWQFDIRSFLLVELSGSKQLVKGKVATTNRSLVCIFVKLDPRGRDEFYVFRWGKLQDYFSSHYKSGTRPKNPESFHCAIWTKDLQRFKDNWRILPK